MGSLIQSFWILAVIFTFSCEESKNYGFLEVKATNSGNYEIYKTSGVALSQITSEQIGHYNNEHKVEAGNYLVLADCSHSEIVIKPNEKITLTAHELLFIPPHPLKKEDLFSIQCTKYEKLQFRQFLNRQLNLRLLTGKHSLLVGMNSMTVEFNDSGVPQKKVFKLAALSVKAPNKKNTKSPYFISPKNSMIAITQPQNFNNWQYLLPGDYEITLNGSKLETHLSAGQAQVIEPGLLSIKSPVDADLAIATKIRGKPIDFTINNEHTLELNAVYPMLPGSLISQLDGSHIKRNLILESGELTSIQLRELTIDIGCSPWEWTCLGSKEVLLFLKDQYYPFTENTTDIPILFSEEDVFIGLLGSHGIRYKLQKGSNIKLKAGFIEIIPTPVRLQGQLTDLVRLEALTSKFSGHTLDIVPNKSTTLTLIEGTYILAQYNASTVLEGDRRLTKRKIKVIPGETVYLRFPYYVSERRFNRIQKAKLKKAQRLVKSRSRSFRHARREIQF